MATISYTIGVMPTRDLLTPAQLARCRALLALEEAPCVIQVELGPLQAALVDSGPRALAERYLGAEERERFLAFSYPKRQAEWLGGRLAAKEAAHRFMAPASTADPNWRQWPIQQNQQGKPFIQGALPPGRKNPAISISHSGGLAVAMATGSGSCGIDLQIITPSLHKVRERFASVAELALLEEPEGLRGLEPLARLGLLWTAKEAYRKAKERTPLLGFLEMRLQRVEGKRETGFAFEFDDNDAHPLPHNNSGPQAHATLHDRFACAITVLF